MADTQTPNPTVPNVVKKGEVKLTVNNITIRGVDRTPKDVKTLRNAQQQGESTYYPNRTALYDLYDDLKMDGYLTGIINKRITGVRNKKLVFKNAEGEEDQNFRKLIKSKPFRKVIKEIMLQKAWGLRGMEFVPGKKLDVRTIPVKHIKPKWGVIATEQSGQEGTNYVGVTNLWILGDGDDFGFLLVCAFYSLLKRGVISDWAQYIEIFGQPLIIAKYDAFDEQTDIALDQALEKAGSSLRLKVPKQAEIEAMDGKASNGDGKLQDTFRKACNEEMGIVVLGNTETTTSSSSSGYAQSKEHGKQQLEITKDDMEDVLEELNSDQFLAILKSYGYNTDGGSFEYVKEIDVVQVKAQMEIIEKAKSMGVPVDDDTVYEISGLPKPKDYDKLKAEMAAKPKLVNRKKGKQGQEAEEQDDEELLNLADLPTSLLMKKWYAFRQSLADFFDPAQS